MIRSITMGILALLTACTMPHLLLDPVENEQPQDLVLIIEQDTKTIDHECLQIYTSGEICTMTMHDYLTGVLLAEMPMVFHEEALKAQAVAARTFAIRQMRGNGKHEGYNLCDQSSCCQAWIDLGTLEQKLGESWQEYVQKAKNAVLQTQGQYLSYADQPIEAVYFSCSGGATEAAAAVWGNDVPYLRSVESPGEEAAPKYHSEVLVSLKEFRKIFADAELQVSPSEWFGEILYTESGGVAEVEIGGQFYTGTELRKRLNLNSTLFTVSITADGVLFDVYGYGHRVGMSQYGANAMAANGKDWREILMHYYTGAEIKKQQQATQPAAAKGLN